jgi:hypothetical protein
MVAAIHAPGTASYGGGGEEHAEGNGVVGFDSAFHSACESCRAAAADRGYKREVEGAGGLQHSVAVAARAGADGRPGGGRGLNRLLCRGCLFQ